MRREIYQDTTELVLTPRLKITVHHHPRGKTKLILDGEVQTEDYIFKQLLVDTVLNIKNKQGDIPSLKRIVKEFDEVHPKLWKGIPGDVQPALRSWSKKTKIKPTNRVDIDFTDRAVLSKTHKVLVSTHKVLKTTMSIAAIAVLGYTGWYVNENFSINVVDLRASSGAIVHNPAPRKVKVVTMQPVVIEKNIGTEKYKPLKWEKPLNQYGPKRDIVKWAKAHLGNRDKSHKYPFRYRLGAKRYSKTDVDCSTFVLKALTPYAFTGWWTGQMINNAALQPIQWKDRRAGDIVVHVRKKINHTGILTDSKHYVNASCKAVGVVTSKLKKESDTRIYRPLTNLGLAISNVGVKTSHTELSNIKRWWSVYGGMKFTELLQQVPNDNVLGRFINIESLGDYQAKSSTGYMGLLQWSNASANTYLVKAKAKGYVKQSAKWTGLDTPKDIQDGMARANVEYLVEKGKKTGNRYSDLMNVYTLHVLGETGGRLTMEATLSGKPLKGVYPVKIGKKTVKIKASKLLRNIFVNISPQAKARYGEVFWNKKKGKKGDWDYRIRKNLTDDEKFEMTLSFYTRCAYQLGWRDYSSMIAKNKSKQKTNG